MDFVMSIMGSKIVDYIFETIKNTIFDIWNDLMKMLGIDYLIVKQQNQNKNKNRNKNKRRNYKNTKEFKQSKNDNVGKQVIFNKKPTKREIDIALDKAVKANSSLFKVFTKYEGNNISANITGKVVTGGMVHCQKVESDNYLRLLTNNGGYATIYDTTVKGEAIVITPTHVAINFCKISEFRNINPQIVAKSNKLVNYTLGFEKPLTRGTEIAVLAKNRKDENLEIQTEILETVCDRDGRVVSVMYILPSEEIVHSGCAVIIEAGRIGFGSILMNIGTTNIGIAHLMYTHNYNIVITNNNNG